jgi:hypothetical protein
MRLALATVAALALPALTSATTAAGPATVAVIAHTTSMRVVDASPKGPSRGDRYIATSRLSNAVAQFGRKRGAVVGIDRSTTTLTGERTARVSGVATLPGGTLRFQGPLREETTGGSLVAPVVGGTGVFAGARGTVTVVGTSRRARNTYRLTYTGSG